MPELAMLFLFIASSIPSKMILVVVVMHSEVVIVASAVVD